MVAYIEQHIPHIHITSNNGVLLPQDKWRLQPWDVALTEEEIRGCQKIVEQIKPLAEKHKIQCFDLCIGGSDYARTPAPESPEEFRKAQQSYNYYETLDFGLAELNDVAPDNTHNRRAKFFIPYQSLQYGNDRYLEGILLHEIKHFQSRHLFSPKRFSDLIKHQYVDADLPEDYKILPENLAVAVENMAKELKTHKNVKAFCDILENSSIPQMQSMAEVFAEYNDPLKLSYVIDKPEVEHALLQLSSEDNAKALEQLTVHETRSRLQRMYDRLNPPTKKDLERLSRLMETSLHLCTKTPEYLENFLVACEFAADRFAVQQSSHPENFIEFLQSIAADQRENCQRMNLDRLEELHEGRVHPPSPERYEAALAEYQKRKAAESEKPRDYWITSVTKPNQKQGQMISY